MELTRRDALAVAATAAAGVAALGMDAQARADEAAGFNPNHADEGYNYTFNNGPLTSAEQHAVISESTTGARTSFPSPRSPRPQRASPTTRRARSCSTSLRSPRTSSSPTAR